MRGSILADRILARLWDAELRELNPHLRDDYRIAWITVSLAERGNPIPHIEASYRVLGLHPENVWPAIVARRKADLGSLYEQFFGVSLPPKKPVESVRLLGEFIERRVGEQLRGKTNAARNGNSAPLEADVDSPPMAASTARAYRNPEGGKSENPSLFSLRQLVESSTWPAEYRDLLLTLLEKNRFGTELWYSQQNLAHDLGKSYSTVRRMIRRLRDGHRFRNRHVGECEGVLEKTIDPNMRPNGVLRRSTTYRLHRQKLKLRPTPEERKNSALGAFCPLPSRPDRPIPPASSVPAPAPQHRSPRREAPSEKPKLSSRDCAKVAAQMQSLINGRTRHIEEVGGYGFELRPGDPRYRAPMHWREALETIAKMWKRSPDVVAEALKFWEYKFEEPEGP